MYACSVLLGDAKVTFFTHAYRVVTICSQKYPQGESHKELVREPAKEGDTSSYYDSVQASKKLLHSFSCKIFNSIFSWQGFIKDGNEYVIYNNYRALPQYLVEYRQ